MYNATFYAARTAIPGPPHLMLGLSDRAGSEFLEAERPGMGCRMGDLATE